MVSCFWCRGWRGPTGAVPSRAPEPWERWPPRGRDTAGNHLAIIIAERPDVPTVSKTRMAQTGYTRVQKTLDVFAVLPKANRAILPRILPIVDNVPVLHICQSAIMNFIG